MRLNIRDSRTAVGVSETAARCERALSGSSVATIARRARNLAGTAFDDSLGGRFVRGFTQAVRSSWLYQWLTAEPDPDVIVIDLRETAIVGPLLGVLDWLIVRTLTYWDGSVLSLLADRSADVFRDRPIQAVSTVVFAAIVANVAVAIATGTPTARAIGIRLLVMSLTLSGTRLTYSAEELTETRVYSMAVALLEPPDPPETSTESREQ